MSSAEAHQLQKSDISGRTSLANWLRETRWFSQLLVLLPLMLVLAFFTPRYETNDDPTMNLIVAGRAIVDRPDEHLIYSNVLIGLALRQLYEAAPDIPWYGGYLFVTSALSLGALGYVFVENDRSRRNVALAAVLILILGGSFLIQLQFTRVAFLATLVGALLLLSSVRTPGSNCPYWLALGFLVVGSLIRHHAHLLALVVASPGLLLLAWKARVDWRSRKAAIILVGAVALGTALHGFNRWYYERDPAWRGFYEFNRLRNEFIDFDRVQFNETTAPIFASVNWQPIDLAMFKNWCHLDRNRFSAESLQKILSGLDPLRLPRTPRPAHKTWRATASDPELLALLSLGVFLVVLLKADASAGFVRIGSYAVATIVCLFIYHRLKLPPRVCCSVFAGCAVMAYFFSAGPREMRGLGAWDKSHIKIGAVIVILAAIVTWRGSVEWNLNRKQLRLQQHIEEMMKVLAPAPDELYVTWGTSFPQEGAVPALQPMTVSRNFKVLSIGWTTQTPFSLRRLESFGLSDLRSMAERGHNIYFIANEGQMNTIAEYLQVHDGLQFQFSGQTFSALGCGAVYSVNDSRRTNRP